MIQRQVNCKILSSLDGVKDVSFGHASPEQRRRNDYSKTGLPEVEQGSFDDVKERMERYSSGLGWM